MSFRSRLVETRKKRNISQAELASRVGLHSNALGRYERGEAIPSVEVATKLASELEISLDYLTGLSDIEIDRVLLDRIHDITSLPEEDRSNVFKVIDALIRDYKASNK
jgi:transcriptional regulator with XRE-family HTH domain